MEIDSKQVVSAFVGAFIALILKAFYDWIIEERKNERLRKLIRTDLKRHLHNLNYIETTAKYVIEEGQYSGSHVLNVINSFSALSLNTAIFESNTFIDYHKAYSEHEFQKLVTLYYTLKEFYKMNPAKNIKNALKNVPNFKELSEQDLKDLDEFTKVSTKIISSWLKALDVSKGKINTFLKLSDTNIY